ncbi:hypothetical protein L9F63_004079 [Diploptera punctata]|uniref:Uncharacterized protein n=1 Tax=Diploptera punctata TaxID=6984 RepID=A0AAD7ZGW7_DIPPU|nr:hypothetical protein L9F63_004079 [Diploptera punctata]
MSMSYAAKEFQTSELDTVANVISLTPTDPLNTFAEMWKHKFGKFFPIFILVMGVLAPLTSGVVSSAAVAFVYRASSLQMQPLYALIWGVGQTFLAACIGFTRILATL